jgi:hypothetical protein
MNRKILISEREKSRIGSLYNLINEQKEIKDKTPFNATLVDIVVSDKGNDPSDMQTTINRLTSTRTNLENFRLKWALNQRRDIYKENKIMSIYNTIRKVISEHIEKRQIISEDKEVRVIKPQVTNKVKDHDTAVKYYKSKNSRLIPHQQISMANFTRSSRSDNTLWVEDPYVEGKKYYLYQNEDFDYARDKDNANTGLFLWNDNGKARPVKQLADIIFKTPITIPVTTVVKEHIEKKQIILEEKKLINKRYKFSLVGINKNKKRIVESTLREERRMLLRAGYNKTIVNETFLDVMNGLYGAEGNNVLKDIKTRLGQKIADQVKNKEDEHNMILTAFEELPEDVIERAIKENRVDELSAMIATKAMEGYKTSFGTEGISGLMFASVDENKFKQEVAKLIEPAIKDITTKMDDKFKQVQDVVSGMGVNPTA